MSPLFVLSTDYKNYFFTQRETENAGIKPTSTSENLTVIFGSHFTFELHIWMHFLKSTQKRCQMILFPEYSDIWIHQEEQTST